MSGLLMCGLAAVSLALLPAMAPGAGRAPTGPAGHIAYVGLTGNLYAVRPDGTDTRALTTDGTRTTPYAEPTWSPNGRGLLAVRFVEGMQALTSTVAGLWLVSPSGGARQLTPNVPRGFAWKPDGRTAVYEEGYPPARTALVQLDTRGGARHTVYCDRAFVLAGVTGIGDRAIGVQGGQIEAVALSSGTAHALTHYPAGVGVWQNVAVLTRSGRAVVYAEAPGATIISLDLRTGRRTTVRVGGTVQGVAPSPDLRWVAYATATPRGVAESKLLRVGMGARPLRGDSYVAPQAFAPDSSALAYTSVYDGPPYVFAATTACPGRCARRLGLGRQAAWEP